MAESLKIEIDVGQAQQALDSLKASFVALGAAASGISKAPATAIDALVAALAKVKPIDTAAFDSVKRLGEALSALQTGTVNSLANELNKLARVDVAKVQANIQALVTSLGQLKIPPGIDAMASSLGRLATAAQQTNQAVRTLGPGLNSAEKAVAALGREFTNAAGFMAGISTSLGQILPHLQTLSQSGMSAKDALGALVQAFGPLGATVAIVGAVATAFVGLGAAITPLVSAVLEATNQFNQFVNVMDSIRGRGAGVETFAQLEAIANRTGQAIGSLTNNYAKFDVAAQSAGMSTERVNRIFENVSGSLTVMGASAEQAHRTWVGMTQMMSKGTVQAEELRQQLGDSIPAAVQMMAQALGVSTRALEGMMRAGQLVSSEVLPKFAEVMRMRFEGGLPQAMEQARAQVALFGNAIQALLRDMGSGNFGGIAGGFAAGIGQITEALKTDGIREFARILGDVLGGAINAVLSLVGGFINGFSAFFQAIASGIQVVQQLLSPLAEFFRTLTGGMTIMGTFSSAFDMIGKAIGFFLAPLIAIKTATMAWGAAVTVATALAAPFAAGLRLVMTAATGMWSALGGPVAAAAMLVFAGLVAFGPQLASFFSGVGQGANAAGQALTAMSPASATAARALGEFATNAARLPNDLAATANASMTMDSAMRAAATSTEALQQTVGGLQRAQREVAMSTRDSQRQTKEYTDGIREQNDRLQQSVQRMQQWSSEASSSAGGARTARGATDDWSSSIDGLNQRIQANNREIRASERAQADRARRDQEYTDSLRQSQEAVNRQINIQREYKAVLSESQVAEVQHLEALGRSRQAAVEQVKMMQMLTQTMEQRAAASRGVAAAQEELAKKDFADIKTLQERIKANEDYLRALGRTPEFIENVNRPLTAMIDKLRRQGEEALTAAASNEAFARAVTTATDPSRAAAEIASELAQRFGVDMPTALGIATKAVNQLAAQQTAAANSGKSLWERMSESISSFVTKISSIDFGGFFQGLLDAIGSFLPSLDSLSLREWFPNVLPAIENLIAALGRLATALGLDALLNMVMELFSSTWNGVVQFMSSVWQQIADGAKTGWDSIVQVIADSWNAIRNSGAIAGTMQFFIDMWNKLKETVVGVWNGIWGAVEKFFGNIVDGMATAVDGVTAGVNKIKEVFTTVVSAIRDMWQSLMDFIKSVIATAESGKGSIQQITSGGGGDANQGREGGIVGVNMLNRPMTVGADAFSNAPGFAEGTDNTSKFSSKVMGGGIPAILHPNEAVVPLSKGRTIPVDLNTKGLSNAMKGPDLSMPLNDIGRAIESLGSKMQRGMMALQDSAQITMPEINVQTMDEDRLVKTLSQKPEPTNIPDRGAFNRFGGDSDTGSKTTDEPIGGMNGRRGGNEQQNDGRGTRSIQNINVTVNGTQFDTFNKTKDQIAKEAADAIAKANKRNG